MKRKAVGLTVVGAAICVAAFLLWRGNASRQTLRDGTVLELSGLKVGRSNVYSHGTRVSKLLGPLAPSNAMNLAGLKLQRPQVVVMPAPEGGEILTAELWLGPGSPQEKRFVSPSFYRKRRLLIFNDDDEDFMFVKEFHDFKQHADGLFSQVYAESYPRDARRLRFRLEEREANNTRDWRETATFVVSNPKRARVEPWKGERDVRIKLGDGLEAEIGELAIRHEPMHPTDIWEHTAFLPMRILRNGQLATNWGIAGGQLRDASGNFDGFPSGLTTAATNDWRVYRIFRPLDPAKVWKFKLGFARDSDFPATNLFSFTVTWPMAGPIHTNANGVPVQIDFVNTDMLSVELTNKPPHLRLTFLKAEDDNGTNLDNRSGSWGQHGFWKLLKLQRSATPTPMRVHATVAIHENYDAEFMLQPRFERKQTP